MHSYATFVIRIRLDERYAVVGGQISHVGTQETVYFRDLDKAMAFVKAHLIPTVDQEEGGKQNGVTLPLDGDTRDSDIG